MPIAALPQTTVRVLGTSQVLTDSASLVKELIDNAIDGRATTISVDISSNTLDDIRVKDNGHGIAPNDRSLACTMHCTSKIRDLDELRDIGGRSLGFRGVALASAAEMSRYLTISTRIEGEETAAELKFDRQGQIASEKRTSLPVGTTVRVERFLETLPVRRQAAEKTSVKTQAKIKRLLQAYALARPNLRLSLKVLKARNEKANWKYPKNTSVGNARIAASSLSAAIDVVGKNVTDQCQWAPSTWSSAGEQIDTASGAHDDEAAMESFTFDTVLATPGCDASIISNHGQYLSVDSRPVSCVRGTMKQIVSIYKSYLRSASTRGDDMKITDPFLCMNIVCPRFSYDVNVEPAKDEVLFANADFVVSLAESCFKIVYGELQKTLPKAAVHKTRTKPSGIDIMLARKDHPTLREPLIPRPLLENTRGHPQPSSIPLLEQSSNSSRTRTSSPPAFISSAQNEDQASGHPRCSSAAGDDNSQDNGSIDNTSIVVNRISGCSPDACNGIADDAASRHEVSAWKTSMYAGGDDEDEDSRLDESLYLPAGRVIEDGAEEEKNLKSVHVSNPWAFAKLNAPFRPPARTDHGQTLDPGSNNQLLTPARQTGDAGNAMEPLSRASAPRGPTTGRSQGHAGNEPTHSSPSPFPFPLKARGRRKVDPAIESLVPSGRERHGIGSLDTWVRKSLGSNSESLDASDDEDTVRGNRGPADIDVAYPGPFVSARSLPMGTPLSDIPVVNETPRRKAAPQKQQQRQVNKPYISPVNDPERVWFETGQTRKQKPQQQPRQRQRQQNVDALILRDDEDADSISESTPLPAPPMHPDLALTMDYEARKQLATQEHRKFLRQQARQTAAGNGTPTSTSKLSPHKNRQNAAIAALHTDDVHPSPSDPPTFGPGDPRAYLIRSKQAEDSEMHKTPANQKSKRRKTTMLPFETLREDTYIGDLIHIIDTADMDFDSMLREDWGRDEYISDGVIGSAISLSAMTKEQVRSWEARLKALTKMQYRLEGMEVNEEMDGELDLDLWSLLQERSEDVASIQALCDL